MLNGWLSKTMPHKIVFHRAAENDLEGIYEYIAERGSGRVAGQYIGQIEADCMKLADFPERGTKRHELLPGLRIVGFERTASIAFMVDADTVFIMRVLYGGRAFPEDWSGGE